MRWKKKIIFSSTISCFIFLFLFINTSFSIPLGSFSDNFFGFGDDPPDLFFVFALTDYEIINGTENPPGLNFGDYVPWKTFEPFIVRNLTLDDVGRTFIIGPANYPYFNYQPKFYLLCPITVAHTRTEYRLTTVCRFWPVEHILTCLHI